MMKEVQLTLTLPTYNTIIQAVQELPWRIANQVLQEIEPQIREALAKSGQTESTPSISAPGAEK